MDDGPRRLQAARWVISVGRLYWALLVAAAAWSLLAVVFTGAPALLLVSVLLAGWATAWGALIEAFRRHRRGAWQLLLALAVLGAGGPLARWLVVGQPSVLDLLWTGSDVVLLALLLHQDSRDWVRGVPGPSRRGVRVTAASPHGNH
jgi:hypothetical protein